MLRTPKTSGETPISFQREVVSEVGSAIRLERIVLSESVRSGLSTNASSIASRPTGQTTGQHQSKDKL